MFQWLKKIWQGHDAEEIAKWQEDKDQTDYLIQVATRAFQTGRAQLGEVDIEGKLTIKEINSLCPKCGGTKFELRNYEDIWHSGNLFCRECGSFVGRYTDGTFTAR